MNLSLMEIGLFLAILSNFSIGLFVLVKQPHRLVSRAFFTIAIGATFWTLGLMLLGMTKNFEVFDKVTLYGFIILIFGFVLFARVFPNQPPPSKKFFLFFVPLLGVACAIPFNVIIESVTFLPTGVVHPTNGPFFPYFIIISLLYVILGLYFFTKTYRLAVGAERLRMNYLFFGLSLFIVIGFICDILLPGFNISKFNFVGPVSSLLLTSATAYAIIRHQLMDIRVIVQRSLLYSALLALFIGLYIIGLQFIGHIAGSQIGTVSPVIAGFIMLIGIFFYRPLEAGFLKVTDPIFFKNSYDYATALHTLSTILRTKVSQAEIIEASSRKLESIFKTRNVLFTLSPTETIAPPTDDGITLPIVFENRITGTLSLGPKRSGDPYSRRDIQLLETFTLQAAMALEKGRLYEQVQEYSAHLEQLVEARTEELSKLQEDQKQTMIDISHNLQTPLAIIKSQLELLPETETTHVVERSLDRVSAFIRQLLHLAKLDHSAYIVELSPLNLSTLMREQADYFEVMAAEESIAITTTIARGVMVLGNKNLLAELCMNLVANAITYRRVGISSTITITLSKTDTDAVLTIEDNGIGIKEEDLEHIFTRFYRTSSTHKERGTGLGLAISKRIIDRHGGTISAVSELGACTAFTITLPLYSKS